MEEVILDNGKYRFFREDNMLYCHRYGEPWRNFLGDHAVTLLFNKVLELLEKKKENENE